MGHPSYDFDPRDHERELVPIITALRAEASLDARKLDRILRRYPKAGRGAFSKSEIIRGFRALAPRFGWRDEEEGFIARLRMKPVRTLSGVAPVTVLTKPFPCPGTCIFCPNDVRMPKSYLAREPGAQRAEQHGFDPYGQTLGRLLAFHHTGHQVDKVELIVLGGTWSFYPEAYQIWFIKRCFDAMNDFATVAADPTWRPAALAQGAAVPDETVDGRSLARTYNQVISRFLSHRHGGLADPEETATWEALSTVQRRNETSHARCVGLVVETRPDHLSRAEVERIRRLGCTKVQIGFQSLSDAVLAANKRGHDVAATRRAVALLRQAGFKLHAHWMPNLYGSDPAHDVEDFTRLFADPDFRPDELKIYPCSLIESAELMQYYEAGQWRPYDADELLWVLSRALLRVPGYCRVTRVIRDIPGDDILVGNKTTNFREVVERTLRRRGQVSRDIRAREIRGVPADPQRLQLERTFYTTSTGEEVFLELTTPEGRLAGFCRLALPRQAVFLDEIRSSAMIREVHVYGAVVGIGVSALAADNQERTNEARTNEVPTNDTASTQKARSQHRGLGRRLISAAVRIAAGRGYRDLAVISSVGTRDYYRGLGFEDGNLYQHCALPHCGMVQYTPAHRAAVAQRGSRRQHVVSAP